MQGKLWFGCVASGRACKKEPRPVIVDSQAEIAERVGSEHVVAARQELQEVSLSVVQRMTPPASSGLQSLLLHDSFLRFRQAAKRAITTRLRADVFRLSPIGVLPHRALH